jgi:hypothetical protein
VPESCYALQTYRTPPLLLMRICVFLFLLAACIASSAPGRLEMRRNSRLMGMSWDIRIDGKPQYYFDSKKAHQLDLVIRFDPRDNQEKRQFKAQVEIPATLTNPTGFVWQRGTELHLPLGPADAFLPLPVVSLVRPASIADVAGIQPGDWFLEVDGEPATVRKLVGLRATSSAVTVYGGGELRTVRLPAGALGLQLYVEKVPNPKAPGHLHIPMGGPLPVPPYRRRLHSDYRGIDRGEISEITILEDGIRKAGQYLREDTSVIVATFTHAGKKKRAVWSLPFHAERPALAWSTTADGKVKISAGESGLRTAVRGCRVKRLLPDGQAIKLDIRVGDLITPYEGRPITSTSALLGLVRANTERQAEFHLQRDGKPITKTAAPGLLGVEIQASGETHFVDGEVWEIEDLP